MSTCSMLSATYAAGAWQTDFIPNFAHSNPYFNMYRKLLFLPFLSAFFACGDGKPGIFSSNGYHIGKNMVWFKSSTGMEYRVTEVSGADPKSFAMKDFLNKTTGESSSYGVDQQHIFWNSEMIVGADMSSFEYIAGGLSKDKRAVYFRASVLTEDLQHFEIVSRQFVKDSKHVYFGGDAFSEDPAHFARVGDERSDYFKDSRNCWFDIYPMKVADPTSLRYLGGSMACDAKNVYFEMNALDGADLKSFQMLEKSYSRDTKQVYLKSLPIEGADPSTFKVLAEEYALDSKHCYYSGWLLPDADPATFQLIDRFYCKDKQRVFINGKCIEGADPATFQVINGNEGRSRDAHASYILEKRM